MVEIYPDPAGEVVALMRHAEPKKEDPPSTDDQAVSHIGTEIVKDILMCPCVVSVNLLILFLILTIFLK